MKNNNGDYSMIVFGILMATFLYYAVQITSRITQ